MNSSHEAPSQQEGALRKSIHILSKILGTIAALIIIFMMISTSADVFRRFIMGAPIPGVTEVGEVLMVGCVFPGLAYAESQRAHVNVSLLIEKLSPRAAAVLNSVGLLIVLIVLIWMVIATGERALSSIATQEYRFGLVQIPVWPGRLAIVIGLAGYLLETLPRFYDDIRQIVAHGK